MNVLTPLAAPEMRDGIDPPPRASPVLHLTVVGDGLDSADRSHFASLAEATQALQRLGVSLAPSATDADVVVVFESVKFKTRRYASSLAAANEMHPHLNKTVCYNYETGPHGIFPGVYVSMPRGRFDPRLHRASTYLGEYNQNVAAVAKEEVAVRYLYSFRGHTSAPVRREMFRLIPSRPDAPMERTTNWFDHSSDQKRTYARELAASAFALCPRGQATSSIRLYEAMQLGRAPVILSDDWVPPVGPDWTRFAVFVPEDRVSDVPEILGRRAAEAPAMGRLARAAWEAHFSPEARYRRFVHDVVEVQAMRPSLSDGHAGPARFRSRAFWKANGWLLHQRLASAVRRSAATLGHGVEEPGPLKVSYWG